MSQGYSRVEIETFGGPEVVKLVKEETLPAPGCGEVRVRVCATSASFTDTMIRRGRYPDAPRRGPMVLGYEFVGQVDAIGAGVVGLSPGDWVADLTMLGSNASHVIREASSLVPMPASLDPAKAVSMVLSYVTAYQMLHRVVGVQEGASLLIHGGGGAVGSALLQLGKLAGLTMFATASPEHHDMIRSCGARPVDYRLEDFVEKVLQWTEGRGVDAVFDFVDIPHFRRSYRCLARGGKLVVYGTHRIARNEHLGPLRMFLQIVEALGMLLFWRLRPDGKQVKLYSITKMRKKEPLWFREDLQALFQWLEEGKLFPVIDRQMPLAEAPAAHVLLEEGGVKGKIILVP